MHATDAPDACDPSSDRTDPLIVHRHRRRHADFNLNVVCDPSEDFDIHMRKSLGANELFNRPLSPDACMGL